MHPRYTLVFLFVCSFFVFNIPVNSANDLERVIIVPNNGITSEALLDDLITTRTLNPLRTLERTGFIVGLVSVNEIDALRASGQVSAVVPDFVMNTHGNGRGILSLPAIYDTDITGDDIGIAILDTGLDVNSDYYPYIQQNITGQFCITNGNCSPLDNDKSNDASSNNEHGTYVASVAAGQLGYAPGATIIPVKVLSDSGNGFASDWLAGLEEVLANRTRYNIDVVNMSLGTTDLFVGTCDTGSLATTEDDAFFDGVKTLIDEMIVSGMVVVASSGNNGDTATSLPACLSNVISVGATYEANIGRSPTQGNYADILEGYPPCFDSTTSLDTIACFSNQNTSVDVVAPGVHTVGGNAAFFGTSFASPAVAGTIALMKTIDPSLQTPAIQTLLASESTPIAGSSVPLLNPTALIDASRRPQNACDATVSNSTALQSTITSLANTNSTICLINGMTYTTGDNASSVSGSIVIEGNGAIINTERTAVDPFTYSLFDVQATGTLEFRDVTITRSRQNTFGNFGTLIFDNITFQDAELSLLDTRIIYNDGAFTMKNSRLKDSSLQGVFLLSLENSGVATSATITDSSFQNNSIDVGGFLINFAEMTVMRSDFSENYVTRGAGDLTFSGYFIRNSGSYDLVQDTGFNRNQISAGRLLLNATTGTTLYNRLSFADNQSLSPLSDQLIFQESGTLSLNNSFFTGGAELGLALLRGNGGIANIANTSFQALSGSIFTSSAALNFQNTAFLDANVSVSSGNGTTMSFTNSQIIGGSTRLNFSGDALIEGSRFQNSMQAVDIGGTGTNLIKNSSFIESGLRVFDNSTLTIRNSTFQRTPAFEVLNSSTLNLQFVTINSPTLTQLTTGSATSSNLTIRNSILNVQDCVTNGSLSTSGVNFVSSNTGNCSPLTFSNQLLLGTASEDDDPFIIPILAESIAVDAVTDCSADSNTVTEDQLGNPRPALDACDVGAFELQPPTDDFEGAPDLGVISGAFGTTKDISDGTFEANEPTNCLPAVDLLSGQSHHIGVSGRARFVSSDSGRARFVSSDSGDTFYLFDSSQSSFDVVIGVYRGEELEQLVPIACNYDAFSGTGEDRFIVQLPTADANGEINFRVIAWKKDGSGSRLELNIENITFTSCLDAQDVPFYECQALLQFYNDTNGSEWVESFGWLDITLICSWYGVVCDNGSITGLNFTNNNVVGIPNGMSFYDYYLSLIDTTQTGTGDIIVTTQAMTFADDGACSFVEALQSAETDTASGNKQGECPAGSNTTNDNIILQPSRVYEIPTSSTLPAEFFATMTDTNIQGFGAIIRQPDPTLSSGYQYFLRSIGNNTITDLNFEGINAYVIQAQGTISLTNITLSKVQGGISLTPGSVTFLTDSRFEDSNFYVNGAGGAGIRVDVSAQAYLNRTTFADNEGVLIRTETDASSAIAFVSINESLFTNNTAGLSLITSQTDLLVKNSAFVNNRSPIFDLFCLGACPMPFTASLVNNTFYDNGSSIGAGISNMDESSVLNLSFNTFIESSSDGIGSYMIDVSETTTINMNGNLFQLQNSDVCSTFLGNNATLNDRYNQTNTSDTSCGFDLAFNTINAQNFLSDLQYDDTIVYSFLEIGSDALEYVPIRDCTYDDDAFPTAFVPLTFDQTNFSRPLGSECDAGSIEGGVNITSTSTDVEITKTIDQTQAVEGSPITITTVIKNIGNFTLDTVDVIETLDSGFDSTTPLMYANGNTYSWASNTLTLTNLPPDSSVTYVYETTIMPGTGGETLTNSADAPALNDANTTNNSDDVSLYVLPQTANLLGVSVEVDDNRITNGMNDFSLRVQNKSNSLTSNFEIWIQLSADAQCETSDLTVAVIPVTSLLARESLTEVLTLMIDRSALYPNANTYETSYMCLLIDANDVIAEFNESDNSNQGDDIDRVTMFYFPWDVNLDDTITQGDLDTVIANFGIAVSPSNAQFDVDGNGVISAADAIGIINRLP